MLLKCYTQYVSKLGKLSSGHRTGNNQFSFQSQRRAMPKNVHTAIQLHSCHMLARLCSKSFKLGFSSTWIENFQMYKLVFQETAEPEVKLPTLTGSWRKEGNSRKTSVSLTMLKPLTVWITANYGKFLKRWEYQTTLTAPWETYMQFKKQHWELNMEQWTSLELGRKYSKAVYHHLAYLIYMQSISCGMLDWMDHKLESRLLGEISTTSDIKMIPL